MITVYYNAVDGYRKKKTFKTLAGARKFAQRGVGETPELGSYYAVSPDGIGTVQVDGASLYDLFPKLVSEDPADAMDYGALSSDYFLRGGNE